jgi:hypothetical protein
MKRSARRARMKAKRRFRRERLAEIQLAFSVPLLMHRIKAGHRVADIASKIGCDEWEVHRRFSAPTELRDISDIAFAMGCRFDVEFVPIEDHGGNADR